MRCPPTFAPTNDERRAVVTNVLRSVLASSFARVSLVVLAITLASGCAHGGARSSEASGGRHRGPAVPTVAIVEDPAATAGGDGKLHFHRNAFALERVDVAAHHFTIWYHHIEPCHCEASVIGDRAYLSGCMWGGMSVPPAKVPPIPSEVEPLVELVEEALHDYEPDASSTKLAYHGHYRTIVVSEMIPIARGAPFNGTELSGWHGRVVLRADPTLSRIEGGGAGLSTTGFGLVDIPPGAARITFELPANEDGMVLLSARLMSDGVARATGSTKALLDASLDAARKVDRGERVATMRALLKAPIDATLPPAYDPSVSLRVTLYARARPGHEQKGLELALQLHPRAAVKDGESIATTEGDIAGLHVRATAKLGAFAPSPATSAQSKPFGEGAGKDVEAPLTVRIDDGRGNVFERTFPARGKLLVDGEGDALAAALPVGLELPGTSAPSKEHDALHVAWPGTPIASSVDVYVDPVLFASPRAPR